MDFSEYDLLPESLLDEIEAYAAQHGLLTTRCFTPGFSLTDGGHVWSSSNWRPFLDLAARVKAPLVYIHCLRVRSVYDRALEVQHEYYSSQSAYYKGAVEWLDEQQGSPQMFLPTWVAPPALMWVQIIWYCQSIAHTAHLGMSAQRVDALAAWLERAIGKEVSDRFRPSYERNAR